MLDLLLIYVAVGFIGSTLYVVYHNTFKATAEEKLFTDKPLEDLIFLPLGILLATIGWPYLVYQAITYEEPKEPEEFSLQIDDLDEHVSIQEIEARHIVFDPLESVPTIPFGHLNTLWESFKKGLNEEDHIFSFEKSHKEYSSTEVRKGYAAVGSDNTVKHFFVYD